MAGRREATGLGAFYATERFLEIEPLPDLARVAGATVAIQGFGQVGHVAARAFRDAEARVIAISDSQGGIYREDGLDLLAAEAYKREHGTIVGLPETKAANAPTTPLAGDILGANGVVVLPDVLVNAGGVTVSFFEWVQNIQNEEWALNDINRRLKHRMQGAVDTVVHCWRQLQPQTAQHDNAPAEGDAETQPAAADLRTAALVVAVRRVARATLQRGIWP